ELEKESVHLIEATDSPEQVAARILAWSREDPAHRLRSRVRQRYTWDMIFTREIEPLLTYNG
ncbi:MAG: hypothetical protein ACM3JD_09005, partial [Rudaea sp.]